jgi:hypothetical protein
VNGNDYNNLPVAELQRRSRSTPRVAEATILASLDYLDANRDQLIADQIEIFRRGTLAEPSVLVPEGSCRASARRTSSRPPSPPPT